MPLVSPETRHDLVGEMRRAMDELSVSYAESGHGIQLPRLPLKTAGMKRAVDRVVSEVLANPKAVVTLHELRQADEYTMLHSIEVCILTTLLGSVVGMGRSELAGLSLAALLHDIGKMAIPRAILNKPGRHDQEETAVMQRHTSLGWTILRSQAGLSEELALVALQHHERFGGGGYPLGLCGERIHQYARLCTVTDVYDAMTADRVYRKGFPPAEALATMTGSMKEAFDPQLLSCFVECVAPYPTGTPVELTDGRRGIVSGIDQARLDRPRVRVLQDRWGRPLDPPYELDLAEEPCLGVVREGTGLTGQSLADLPI